MTFVVETYRISLSGSDPFKGRKSISEGFLKILSIKYRVSEFPQSRLATVASEESDRRNMSFQAKRLKMPMLPMISYRVHAWESWQVAFDE
jgi:hypothetical protein